MAQSRRPLLIGHHMRLVWVAFSVTVTLSLSMIVLAFVSLPSPAAFQYSEYRRAHNDGHGDDFSFSNTILQERLTSLRISILQRRLSSPPYHDSTFSASEFITRILKALREPDDPFPDEGYRTLLLSSTVGWKRKLYSSVGATLKSEVCMSMRERRSYEDKVASALGAAISRPGNQFAILVGDFHEDYNCGTNKDDVVEYYITFPGDVLDFEDGTCWVECQLRNIRDDSLLVVMGWSLVRHQPYAHQSGGNNFDCIHSGAWMLDGIVWHDFRDMYRPGVGQEEWIRICG